MTPAAEILPNVAVANREFTMQKMRMSKSQMMEQREVGYGARQQGGRR
jgi:hypothetical protein